MKYFFFRFQDILMLAFIIPAILSCVGDAELSHQDEMIIVDDSTELGERLIPKDENITIEPEGNPGGRIHEEIVLNLKAELIPPILDGVSLQATSIANRSDYFVVCYNVQGNVYAGGLDLISSDLKLKAQLLHPTADINDCSFSGDNLFFVGATKKLENPAFVAKILVRQGTFKQTTFNPVSAGSYAANSVYTLGNNFFLTSGNNEANGGGLYHYNNSLNLLNYRKITDARWVTMFNNKLFVLSGVPARVTIWKRNNLQQENEFKHEGIFHPEAKATLDVDKNMVFIAGGSKGLLVYDVKGNKLFHHEFIENHITNAVSIENGKAFVSNGAGGVYVATYDENAVNIIGKLSLGDYESVNHIVFKSNRLYVASGKGGVKMIDVK